MIHYLSTNILEIEAEALVNTVNTVGIMGKGIALQFKEKFLLNYNLYKKACKNNELQIGKMFVTNTGQFTNPRYIINFPTKTDWRSQSRIEYINEGLDDLIKVINEKNIKSIALPPLGCGNGGLDWTIVKPLMEKKLTEISNVIQIDIIEPGHHSYVRTTKASTPPLTKARAIILALADSYRVLGFDISHLELQKLAYFMQEMGQVDLKLNYSKGTYGPYATNLKHLLAYLEGYYIKGQIRFQDLKPIDPLQLSEDKLPDVHTYLRENLTSEESSRLEKVQQFITGFESPFGLELLATVLWARQSMNSMDITSIVEYVHNWSERKKRLMITKHIEIALSRINNFFPS